jgi:hypothetical protein
MDRMSRSGGHTTTDRTRDVLPATATLVRTIDGWWISRHNCHGVRWRSTCRYATHTGVSRYSAEGEYSHARVDLSGSSPWQHSIRRSVNLRGRALRVKGWRLGAGSTMSYDSFHKELITSKRTELIDIILNRSLLSPAELYIWQPKFLGVGAKALFFVIWLLEGYNVNILPVECFSSNSLVYFDIMPSKYRRRVCCRLADYILREGHPIEYPCNHCWSRNIPCFKNSKHRKCVNYTRHGIPCGVPFISGVVLKAFLKDEARIGVQLQETQDEINFLSSQLSTAVARL